MATDRNGSDRCVSIKILENIMNCCKNHIKLKEQKESIKQQSIYHTLITYPSYNIDLII